MKPIERQVKGPGAEGTLAVGDMVTRHDGTPGKHMVLRVLEGGMVRIRRWPIIEAPLADEVPASEVTRVEPDHLQQPPLGGEHE